MEYHSGFTHLLFLQVHSLAAINTQGTTVLMIVLCCLLFFSFVISGAEVAYFSLTHKDINLLKTKQQPAYKRIINLTEEPKVLLGCLLIANSFINIAIIIISNILLGDLFSLEKINALWLEFLLKIIIVTAVLLLFCEVMPKVLAAQNNIRFAKDAGPIIEFVFLVCKRSSIWLVKYSDVIEKKLSRKSSYSLEELDHAIDLTTDNSASIEEKNILKGIIKFGNITVKQVMKTRIDVDGIDSTTSFTSLISQLGDFHYSRLPVYEEDLDKVIGMVHTKDLIPHLEKGDDFNWHQLLRVAFFVHEQRLIEDLLKEFQNKHIHFAIVVDEFGGTSGIVTMEDILEEVIGEIKDEFDEEETNYEKIDDNNYIFDGKTMLNDVCKAMSLNADTFDDVKGESDSLAGLVLEITGAIPNTQQVISSGDFEFTILQVEKNRLIKIKVTIKPQSE
ncbi:gliding motility-associated protein GldE [Parasediminibacterium sp. JCM 36343]|uniref:gliding motility-associated protein GldE n=1 Tax=Parasediminibacterium sp. JCM 36343 TaxID=3374279 RepID=UPI00397E5606